MEILVFQYLLISCNNQKYENVALKYQPVFSFHSKVPFSTYKASIWVPFSSKNVIHFDAKLQMKKYKKPETLKNKKTENLLQWIIILLKWNLLLLSTVFIHCSIILHLSEQ